MGKEEYQVSKKLAKEFLEWEFYLIPNEYRERFVDFSILDLITAIDQNTKWTGAWDKKEEYFEESYELEDAELVVYAKIELLNRLELARWSDLNDLIWQRGIEELKQKLDNLETQFKQHRHRGAFSQYTEKPAW